MLKQYSFGIERRLQRSPLDGGNSKMNCSLHTFEYDTCLTRTRLDFSHVTVVLFHYVFSCQVSSWNRSLAAERLDSKAIVIYADEVRFLMTTQPHNVRESLSRPASVLIWRTVVSSTQPSNMSDSFETSSKWLAGSKMLHTNGD